MAYTLICLLKDMTFSLYLIYEPIYLNLCRDRTVRNKDVTDNKVYLKATKDHHLCDQSGVIASVFLIVV